MTGATLGSRCRLPHSVIVKAPGLLPMYYTAKELVEELDVSYYVIKQWIDNGLPYHRDSRHHIMIDGRKLATWVTHQRQLAKGPRLEPDQGLCMRCKKPVRITNPVKCEDRKRALLKGNCEFCDGVVCRGIKHG